MPPVLNAADLLADPNGLVGAWCASVALEHRTSWLTWATGMPADWALWADWFERGQ